jgi:hypothetical protein
MNLALTAQGWPQRAGHECCSLAQVGCSECSLGQCAVLLPYGTLIGLTSGHRSSSSVIKNGTYCLTTGHIGMCSTSLPRVSQKLTLYHILVCHLHFNWVWFWQQDAVIYLATIVNVTENVPEGTRMYQKIPECVRMYQNIRMYQNVTECTRRYHNVLEGTRMYQNVTEGTRSHHNVSEGTRRHHNVSEGTRMYHNVPERTIMYQKVPECTRRYQNVPEGIIMYQNVPECTSRYQNVPVWTLRKLFRLQREEVTGDWRGFLICTHQQI